ncbi:acetate--CoA ligase [Rhodosalinus halophilus]|uniref:acetate--CoA ligase n=1 Tax=Rhodosalinus halophilus TaxID=2259333 RepID=A0A365UD70_9RHOB|nr:acetate--CoA ligase [Rhodosalinus halophilus]RBI87496.1 acetate--CoA ligase [Rhodosalinus halophilus]
MDFETIRKTDEERQAAQLSEAARESFTWEQAGEMLDGLPEGGLNIAHEAVDRHAAGAARDRVALRWLGRDGARRDLTYGDLAQETARFAGVLRRHGVAPGARLYLLAGRVPELYVAALGALKAGLTVTPLFAAFGPEPIRMRMEIGEADVLVTTAALYRRKVADWRAEIPSLKTVIVVDDDAPEGCLSWTAEMAAAEPVEGCALTDPEDVALIHFTSGTTGRPKGVLHVHQAVVAHAVTGRYALELVPGVTYWCTADPGWVTGTSYGLISPLVNGATMIVDEAEFDTERWLDILAGEKIEVWYTAPTAIRRLMRAGPEAVEGRSFPQLRHIASVGEPLNPEGVVWGQKVFGMPFHDTWWQTETGAIMIANTAAMDIRPGSMGRPMPGIEAGVVDRQDDGSLRPCAAGEPGELALRPGWPSMMRGYLGEEARYRKAFADGWYLSGDLAIRDADGYFWFVGRADDLIKSAGHLIGPFEVESALIEHPAVAEAAVIGLPDETAGEIVQAYVALNPGHSPSAELERDIRGHARKRLGPAVAPREIVFRDSLPKTRSGKIMRRLLKARELGLPEGDTSTLETEDTPARSPAP